MSELLRISGIAVPVLVGTAKHKPTSIGEVERAEDGTKLISRRAIKESFTVRVAPQSPTDGIAWKKLLTGEGHTWPFSTVYSSKGLGPSAATDESIDTAEKKFGASSLKLVATSGTVTFLALPPAGTKWTVMVWRLLEAGSWEHYLTTSTLKAAGDAYVDGVLDASEPTSWLTVNTTTGSVKLDADASDNTYFDDLVIFPFEVPADWAAQIVAYGAAFSRLAKLDVDGDLVDANIGTKTVCAEVTDVDVMPGYLNGAYYQSIRTIDAILEEG